jgi:hypothetical protein
MSRRNQKLLLFPCCYNVRCALCRANLKIGQTLCGTTFFADTFNDILGSARQYQLPGLRNACCTTCKHNTDTKTKAWAFHYDCLKTLQQSFDINSAGLRSIVKQLDHRQPEVKDSPEVLQKWKELEAKEGSLLEKIRKKLPPELLLMVIEEIDRGFMRDEAFLNAVKGEQESPSSEKTSVVFIKVLKRLLGVERSSS